MSEPIRSDEDLAWMRGLVNGILEEITVELDGMALHMGRIAGPGIQGERADAAMSAYQYSSAAVRTRLLRQP